MHTSRYFSGLQIWVQLNERNIKRNLIKGTSAQTSFASEGLLLKKKFLVTLGVLLSITRKTSWFFFFALSHKFPCHFMGALHCYLMNNTHCAVCM